MKIVCRTNKYEEDKINLWLKTSKCFSEILNTKINIINANHPVTFNTNGTHFSGVWEMIKCPWQEVKKRALAL